jgi:hypothetical protein
MTARPVLVIHTDAARRNELKALLRGREVLEASSRAEAVPLLSQKSLALVLSQPVEFRRLLRDLERHAPGTPRAVLYAGDAETLRQLAELASEGYEFFTVAEGAMSTVRGLVEPRGSPRLPPSRPLTAHFVAGATDFVAEVVELGNEGLGLALPPSAPVEVLTPGLELHQATATDGGGVTLERRTWVVRTLRREGDGGGRVLVGVSVEPPPPEVRERAPLIIRDEVRARGLIRRAVARGAEFVLRTTDAAGPTVQGRVELLPDGHLALCGAVPFGFEPGEIGLLSFELLGSQVEGATAVVERQPTRLVLTPPRTVQRRDRREALRVRVPPEAPVTFLARSPLTGRALTARVVDLHPLGASFELEADDEVLPPGLRLGPVTLDFGGTRCRAEAVVQGARRSLGEAGRWRIGVRLTTERSDDRVALLDAWLRLLVPGVVCGSRFDFASLWALFEREQVRFPDYPFDQPRTLEVLSASHRALGDGRHGLARTFVFTDGGEVLGHASGLRTHSKTWLSQHLVVRSGYHRQTHISQALVNLSFDYAEGLGDVEYLRGLWRTSNRWTARIYGAATARLLKPGSSYLASFTPMRLVLGGALPASPLEAREATAAECEALLAHLRRTWDPLRLAADDLVESELGLQTLRGRFAALGLERSRHVGVVPGPGGPRGWVLIERMSPGLFWAEMYDSFRIVLRDARSNDADDVRLALTTYALSDAARRGRRVAQCLAEEQHIPALERFGFANLGRVMEFGAHRSMNREMTAQLIAIFERVSRRGRALDDCSGDSNE